MLFSRRTAWDTAESAWSLNVQAVTKQLQGQGKPLLDLTASNPVACGFRYDTQALLSPLGGPGALLYEPLPFGPAGARSAVAGYYRSHGADVNPASVCLVTSTSEAYSYLFRLLCDPGDEVLVATPSYPLFDFIAGLDGVGLREYPLVYDDGWQIDFHALEAAVTPRTRAVLVVHPNNPTGNFCTAAEREALQKLCAERDLALIVDEVFLDYALAPGGPPPFSFHAGNNPALTFVLSGVSKVCGLPGMKCSWIAASGPEPLLRQALARLEVVADTFLSLSAPAGFALPAWLADRSALQQQVRERCRQNLTQLDSMLAGMDCGRLRIEGGWTAVLRVPRYGFAADGAEGALPFAEAALRTGVLVQPGAFYGLGEGRVVLSLLTPTSVWAAGLTALTSMARAGREALLPAQFSPKRRHALE